MDYTKYLIGFSYVYYSLTLPAMYHVLLLAKTWWIYHSYCCSNYKRYCKSYTESYKFLVIATMFMILPLIGICACCSNKRYRNVVLTNNINCYKGSKI